ncbi:MAG TPA: MFS transporter [Actinomycetota bacterium]|nr:MFS transporter [Actinomycetota bacterium]
MGLFGFEGSDAREKVIVLLTMCFALAMVMIDNTVVNVALPTLNRELGASISDLQWIVDGYVLAFASLLLTGGIIGDRYGRKRTFLTGLAVFTASSLACALAADSAQLIAARAVQGVGAALLMPGTLSILTVTFPPQERAKAIGLWAGVSGLALALGPTLGGYMVEHLGWESVFFVNVPIGIVAMAVAIRTVRESRSDEERRLDIGGLLLGTGSLFGFTYALIEANQLGWTDPLIVGGLTIGALLGIGFLAWEHRTTHPMLPLAFFRIPAFTAGNVVAFSVSLGMFATFFFLSLFMQNPFLRGYTAFETGLRFLPMTLMIVVTAPNAGRYASKHGSRAPMTYGLILAGGGLIALSRLTPDTPYWVMAVLFVIMGHGMASTMAPMTAAVMNAVGPQRAGLGSATTNSSREVGGVFGIALLGTILFTRLESVLGPSLSGLGLTPGQRTAITSAAGHGQLDVNALRLDPQQAAAVGTAFGDAFLSGFRLALLVAGLALLAAAIVANRFIPGRDAAIHEVHGVVGGTSNEPAVPVEA